MLANNPIVLTVRGLAKIYGPGCPQCFVRTGPAYESNICPLCGTIVACHDISFDLAQGEILGIVGESGSGKSTLVRCLYFDEEASSGESYLAVYQGGRVNLLQETSQHKRHVRNHLMGMVYQNPLLGIKPHFTAGGNVAEKLLTADIYNFQAIRERAANLLARTEVPIARMDDFPAHFSGGMQQRVQIAKALANNPPLLFLDEITTGLDVSVQAKVLDLVKEIQRELGIAMVAVSHDLGVIRMLSDRTAVMKNGRMVEIGLTDQILEDPQHQYTQLLVHSML
ncbi:Putative phosphonates utilization ATP-binding protein PhnK [Sporomusa silvacetica DSM 10669]|uniref:Phosphonates utilization ATP-binding protein PhnK n=1 Tax=Sporomusa silvacetica DSM 10669 TaxID=1123289 RepID=A0ABZ3IRR0_9FIRM|nr:ATP-binding cassette domain-containing protein [Sporomusa silvacetica]OZC20841.1 putative phosphonates utilization ATP-binding protein PhnK [Sporomusa silvacetica DSM 10669]